MSGQRIALGLLLATVCASCTTLTSDQVRQLQYAEAKRNCHTCFGVYDDRCSEPTLSLYVGRDIAEICGSVVR